MKLRTRFHLYLIIACVVPLIIFFALVLMLWFQKHPYGLVSQELFNKNVLGFLVALVAGIVLIGLFSLYLKSVINRVKELTDFFRVYPTENPLELKPDPYFDEIGKLRQSLIDMIQRIQKGNMDFEDRYRKLLLSNMNLEEKYAQSYTIELILEEIGRELDSDQLLKKTSDIIMGVFGSKRCIIYMVDEEQSCLVIRADSGIGDSNWENSIIPINSDNIIARSWRTKRVFTEADAKPKELKTLKAHNVDSFHGFPLAGRRGGLGVIIIEHQVSGGFTTDLEDFAKLIAQEISLSVENAYLYEQMRLMANHDALTGVYNRMYLMNYMGEIFTKGPGTVSVIMFDMDYFKKVNDKYGHLAGDMVLKTAASIIQMMLPTGILGRYGGEEFVVLLPEINQDEAYKLADAMRCKINEHNFITAEGVRIPVTISAGLANYPKISDSFKGLLQLADEALYEAKNSGRNKVSIAAAKAT
jgi:diguanylate cyclase (GGDEF)-like protein